MSLPASKNSYKFQPKNYRREKTFHTNIYKFPNLFQKTIVLPTMDPTETVQWPASQHKAHSEAGELALAACEHTASQKLCLPARDSMASLEFPKSPGVAS